MGRLERDLDTFRTQGARRIVTLRGSARGSKGGKLFVLYMRTYADACICIYTCICMCPLKTFQNEVKNALKIDQQIFLEDLWGKRKIHDMNLLVCLENAKTSPTNDVF